MAYDVGVLEEPSFSGEASIRELGESDLDQVSGAGCLVLILVVATIVVVGAAAYQQGREDGYEDTKCS